MQKILVLLVVQQILSQAYAQSQICGAGALTCNQLSYLTCLPNGWFQTMLPTGTSGVGCSACNPMTTALCTSGVTAQTCQTGFQLMNGVCVNCQPNMNATCPSTCTSSGFFTSGSTCLFCESQSAVCDSSCAAQGFYNSASKCLKCPVGTKTCESATKAISCQTGFFLGAGAICSMCPDGQATCSVSSVISSCTSGNYLDATTNTCKTCATSKTSACQDQCKSAGFYTVGATCESCAVNAALECNAACLSQGFYSGSVTTTGATPVTTKSCNQCPAGQSACKQNSVTDATQNIATACLPLYYLASRGVCTLCSTVSSGNQITCQAAVVPLICDLGYFVNQTSCVGCGSSSKACQSPCTTTGGFYTNGTVSSEQSCLACGTGAANCFSPTNSTGCITGYYLQNVTCVKVSQGALATSNPASTACQDGFYISSLKCAICSAGAKQCTSATLATNCLDGWVINVASKEGNQCVQCSNGAKTCSALPALSCDQGFYLSAGICTSCASSGDVDACKYSGANDHVGCKSGKYLASTGVCTACSGANAANTYQCVANGGTRCNAQYFAIPPYTATACGTKYSFTGFAGAGAQAEVSATEVSACLDSYYLSQTTAAGVTTSTCTQCSANALICKDATTIQTCNVGYVLANNQCQPCLTANTNTATCKATNYKVLALTSCSAGYYVSALVCSKCTDTAGKIKDATLGTTALAGQAFVLTCEMTTATGANAGEVKAKTLTCAVGYSVTTKDGCFSCSGSATVTGYKSCTTDAKGIVTVIVCDAGYALVSSSQIALAICAPCNPLTGDSSTTLTGQQCTLNFELTSCKSGSFLDTAANTCTGACQTGIKECGKVSDANEAISCISNYVQIGKTCQQCTTNAVECSATASYVSSTNACNSGFVSIQGQCFACPSNAATCSANLLPQSTGCSSGYFVSNGVCTACQDTTKVDTCTSATVATKCKAGNFLVATSNPTAVACTACANVNTLSCSSATVAISCTAGFYLVTSSAVVTCTTCGITNANVCTASLVTSCNSGYFKASATTCTDCAAGGADECTDATTATKCLSGFKIISGKCWSCGINAASCDSYLVATKCNSGYAKSSANVCNIRCPGGASECSSTSVATTCFTGYYLSQNSCIKCSANADQCSKATYAATCNKDSTGQTISYYLNSGSCVACTEGASDCTSTGVSSCGTGYVLITGETKCTKCSVGASTCTTSSKATACIDGYYIDTDKCSQCSTGIAKCSSGVDAGITLCQSGYSKIASAGTCQKCTDIYATECTTATTVSSACQGSYVISGSVCVPCQANTKTCDAPVSTLCQTGFAIKNNVCVACASSTLACDSSCTSVSTSNITPFVTKDTTCVSCPTNSNACSDSLTATGCLDGFYLASGKCNQCTQGASKCTATSITECQTLMGYFAVTTNSVISCQKCSEGALTCTSADLAATCESNYYLNAVKKCEKCTGSNTKTCSLLGSATTCNTGFYPLNGVCLACLDSSSACQTACQTLGFFTLSTTTTLNNATTTKYQCSACSTNALTCLSATQAQSCANNYYLDGNAVCQACGTNGVSCDLKPSFSTCAVGFSSISGNCVKCPANFATCSSATNGTLCVQGFFLAEQWVKCSACPDNSVQCTSLTVIQVCANGFYPTPIQGNQVSCTQCPQTNNQVNCYNASYATSCKIQYGPVNGTCVACDPNAATCNGKLINQCLDGYYIVNQYMEDRDACMQCGSGAKTCISNSTAITCLPGYGLLSSGTCVKCSTGASDCSSATVATKCFASFNAVSNGQCLCQAGQGPSTDGTQCGSCPANCASCSSTETCTTCTSSLFSLNASTGKCVGNCGDGKYLSAAAAASGSSTTSNSTTSNPSTSNSTTSNSSTSNSTNATAKRILQSCMDCPNGCATCTSGQNCQTCNAGFNLNGQLCNTFAGKLSIGNIFMMIALFALIIKQ